VLAKDRKLCNASVMYNAQCKQHQQAALERRPTAVDPDYIGAFHCVMPVPEL
jgi:hypothetical protein